MLEIVTAEDATLYEQENEAEAIVKYASVLVRNVAFSQNRLIQR